MDKFQLDLNKIKKIVVSFGIFGGRGLLCLRHIRKKMITVDDYVEIFIRILRKDKQRGRLLLSRQRE